MDKIILASSSPRRKELLEMLNIPFTIIKTDIDESIGDEVSPYDMVKIISTRKAMSVVEKLKSELNISNDSSDEEDTTVVISADTIVCCKGIVLGKPKNSEDAYKMLKYLQGKHHSVYTGMTVAFKNKDGITIKNIVDNTIVFMRALTDDEIWAYIKTNEPFDKAGAYGIQEKGSLLVEKIEGDYFTIVGLPVVKLYAALKEYGIDLTKMWKS